MFLEKFFCRFFRVFAGHDVHHNFTAFSPGANLGKLLQLTNTLDLKKRKIDKKYKEGFFLGTFEDLFGNLIIKNKTIFC